MLFLSDEEVLKILGRDTQLFALDYLDNYQEISQRVKGKRVLVLGGAGSIGQAVTKAFLSHGPKAIHVVDLSENNLVELVRDIRNSFENLETDFKTFCIDISSVEYSAFISSDGQYDYVLNLSAMKHVRSERDPFTAMRMIKTNVVNTIKTLHLARANSTLKYFSVSTDKAAAPASLMGATKKAMELALVNDSTLDVSSARFANVAFSDGSLLKSFQYRFSKMQPITGPSGIERYFMTETEAGILCLLSCVLGKNNEIYFPKSDKELNLTSFKDIAARFLENLNFVPVFCESEKEARQFFKETKSKKHWPCFFPQVITSGEKPYEEFHLPTDKLVTNTFMDIGIIQNRVPDSNINLKNLLKKITEIDTSEFWDKEVLVSLMRNVVPEFQHIETGKDLDQKI